MHKLSTAAAILALALLPAAMWAEQANPRLWHERLLFPALEFEPDRHTPRNVSGTYLPPVISGSRTLTAADSPVMLPATTRIAPNATLAIEPGTLLLAHEFAGLTVAGTLSLAGSADRPVVLSTNEAHPQNQIWNGIVVEEGGKAFIQNAKFRYATPAVSCLAGSAAAVSQTTIQYSAHKAYTESEACDVRTF